MNLNVYLFKCIHACMGLQISVLVIQKPYYAEFTKRELLIDS